MIWGSMYGMTERALEAVLEGLRCENVPLHIFRVPQDHISPILSAALRSSGTAGPAAILDGAHHLIQLHNLTDPDEWEQAFSPGGALEALIEARRQGLTRFIGVTGHGYTAADMHLNSLERFDLDSVLLPNNYVMMQNESYARSFDELEQRCTEKNAALQTIKSLARRPWKGEGVYTTWYQPLDEEDAVRTAVQWVLGNPDVFLISASDIRLLPRVLEAAGRTESRPGDSEMEQMLRSHQMQPIFRGSEFVE